MRRQIPVKDAEKFTGTALRQAVLSYIPHQFLKDVDMSKLGFDNSKLMKDGGIDILQKLLDKSNSDLRMYGSAKELAEDLQKYRCFPSSHKKMGIEITEEYNIHPVVLLGLNSIIFVSKQDIFVCLQRVIFPELPKNTPQLSRSIIMIFLKTCEKRVSGCYEFVRFHQQMFGNIAVEMKKILIKIQETNNTMKSQNFSFEEIFEEWKPILPDWTDQQYDNIRIALQTHFKSYPMEKFPKIYTEAFVSSKILIEMLQKIMNSSPEIYLPYDKTRTGNPVVAVQVFVDGKQQFVMKSQLFAAINIINPDEKPLEKDDKNGFLYTMEIDEVKKKFRDQFKKIQFLRTFVNRTVHRALPIMTPTGEYCITAYEAFWHIINHLILVLKIFQKIKSDSWHVITDYMKWLEKEFKMDMKCRYFITLEVVERIEKQTEDYFKKYENQSVKSVRNVRKVGFTVNYLKNELKELGLTDVFPNITDYASLAYNSASKTRKEKYLRTSDLIYAILQCQLLSVFDRLPELNTFFHNQKACLNLLNKTCHSCLTTEKTLNASKSMWNEEGFPNTGIMRIENFGAENAVLKVQTQKGYKEINGSVLMNSLNRSEVNTEIESMENKNVPSVDTSKSVSIEFERSRKQKSSNKKETKQSQVDEREKDVDDSDDVKYQNMTMDVSTSEESENEPTICENCQEYSKLLVIVKQMNKDLDEAHNYTQTEQRKLENQLKEKDEEIEKMKQRISICIKENDSLKLKVSKRTDNETKLKETNKKITNSRNQLLKQIAQLETQLKSEKQMKEEIEQEVITLKEDVSKEEQRNNTKIKNLEKENLRNKGIIAELTDSQIQLSSRIHQLESQLECEKQNTQKLEQEVISCQQITEYNQMKDNLEKEILKNEEVITELTDSRIQLSKRVYQLESQLECEKQKSQQFEQESIRRQKPVETDQMSSDAKKSFENEISGLKRLITELENKNLRLSIQNEEQEKMFKVLLDKLASGSTSNKSETSKAVVENSDGIRYQLVGLQKIKDSFRHGIQLKQAKEMVEKVISLTNRSEIHQLANYEFQKFEGQIRNYTQAVETNIQRLKRTSHPADLLPEYPVLSERFMKEYWNEVDKQPSTSSESSSTTELEDPECLICLSNVESSDETIKCEHCRRRYHSSCASEWLKTKMVCPACNRALLNPSEFPALS